MGLRAQPSSFSGWGFPNTTDQVLHYALDSIVYIVYKLYEKRYEVLCCGRVLLVLH